MAKPLNETLLANKRHELNLAIANHKYGRAEHLEGEIAKLLGGKPSPDMFALTDRQKINALMDMVGENDPAMREYILKQCADDVEIRRGYVSHYHQVISEAKS